MLMKMSGSGLFIFFFIFLTVECLVFLVNLTTGGFVDLGEDCPQICRIWPSSCAMCTLCAPSVFFRGATCVVLLAATV